MKITKILIYQIDLPCGDTYYISGGRSFESLDSTVVAIHTDAGITGWGEACPFGPYYTEAFARGVRAGVAELAPRLLGQDPGQVEHIYQIMDATLRGHGYVKAAIDAACWDILGKVTDTPVYKLMGGKLTEELILTSSISSGTPEDMAANVASFRAQGYLQHSAKAGGDPEQDIARFSHVASQLRAKEVLAADANCGWLTHEAIRVAQALKGVDIYFEQPCATFEECVSVRKHIEQPLILDEIIMDVNDVTRVHQHLAADVINLKITRVGGLSKARQIRDLCTSLGIGLWIQETGGSQIANAGIAHLGHSTREDTALGVWDCTELAHITVADHGPELADGRMRAPNRPGLGIEPKLDVLGEPTMTFG